MDFDLTQVGSWASILSLVISIISLILIRSVRSKIVKLKRSKRIKQVIDEVFSIPNDAIPLSGGSKSILNSLSRNLPKGYFHWFSKRSKIAKHIHNASKTENIIEIKQCLRDWFSYSEDL